MKSMRDVKRDGRASLADWYVREKLRKQGVAAPTALDMATKRQEMLRRRAILEREIDASGWKVCRACGDMKAPEMFYRDANGGNGLQAYCKPCSDVKARAWRESNADRVRESDRARRRDAERLKVTRSAWAARNPDRLRVIVERAKHRYIQNLGDGYVREKLRRQGIPDPPAELVGMKREQIAMRRVTRQLVNTISEIKNGN